MIFAIMRSLHTNKKDDDMYDTTIAAKLLKQLEAFLGRISPHFHKPTACFIGNIIYRIMVEKDIKLASIARAWKEKITPKRSRTDSAEYSLLRVLKQVCTTLSPAREQKRSIATL